MKKQYRMLNFLYDTKIGRIILKPMVSSKRFSNFVAYFIDRKISKLFIKPFIKKNGINMDDFENKKYNSFNDFFIRKIKKNKRPISKDNNTFIAPCDSKLTCYKIDDKLLFNVKNSTYSVESLINNKTIAKEFNGGYALVFRLSPDDYHRYMYIDDGVINDNYKIDGIFNTVNPIVYDKYMVFKENQRECTYVNTKNFGKIMYIEVGALLVGKIVNAKNSGSFKRAEEKGYFMYGGSTVILLIEKNKVKINNNILTMSKEGKEITVKYGETIGYKI